MINAQDMQPNPPLLQDGFNEGFRAPDQGWVGAKDPDAELDADLFDAGSLVFSNFWAGPIEHAQAFASALVFDFQRWLNDGESEQSSGDLSPVVTVAYWEDPVTGLALVATQSITPDFMLEDAPESFEAFDRFGPLLTQVAFDGNDNSPHEALTEIVRLDSADRTALVQLILACVPAEDREEIQAFYDDECTVEEYAEQDMEDSEV